MKPITIAYAAVLAHMVLQHLSDALEMEVPIQVRVDAVSI